MNHAIGVIVGLKASGSSLAGAHELGLRTAQLCCWNPDLFTPERADAIQRERAGTGMDITSLWAGWPGPRVWDFVEGPSTLGIVPAEYRAMRVAALKQAGDWAHRIGLPAVVTHLGFIPENARDPVFAEVVGAVREIAEHLKTMGMEFWFETGQETPVTMLRLIESVGTGNLGINLDPANLILYGKGNPIDALDVFGPYVRSIHAKDGLYPTDPMKLGREVKVGAGRVRFPEFVRRLDEIGFTGAFIIEREISGDQQRRDILDTVAYLTALFNGRDVTC